MTLPQPSHRRRNIWKEYRIQCCVDCAKNLEAAWYSHHHVFGPGKRFVEVEPEVFMTNLSYRDVARLRRNSFMKHPLDAPLTGYDPDGPAPWDTPEDEED